MRINGLELWSSGSGGPPVVFLPGAGLYGLDFRNIHERAAAFTTSVLYDRAGTGWSDDVELPRTPGEVVRELRELLRAAEISGPYLLVGHSLGAFYARRFAQLFPSEVAGLLLLDPGHEDIFDYLPDGSAELAEKMKPDVSSIPDLTAEQIETARGQYAQLYAEWSVDIRDALIEKHLTTWRSGVQETENFETEVYDELRGGGPLPDVPLIVYTAGAENPYWAKFLTADQMREALAGVQSLHAALAAVPRGEHRVLSDASHQYMHIQHPDAITQAIRDLLAAGESQR